MPHRHCSLDQMFALYHWGREQGYPVNQLNWEEYVEFLRRVAPHKFATAIGGAPSFAHPCIFDRWEQEEKPSLLFDGQYLYWRQGRKSTSWRAYSGDPVTLSTGNYSVKRQKVKNKGPLPAGWYTVPQGEFQELKWYELHQHAAGLLNIPGLGGSWANGGMIAWGTERVGCNLTPKQSFT